jgi:hypothetical protein
MVLDPDLVHKALGASARIEAAECEVHAARVDYHTIVRRLHLSGGSLREIARALGVSHQRVQQIVDTAGGTWWQRVWRTRNAKHELLCTFCDKVPAESAKLIAGPDVFVCDACVALAEKALARGRAADLTRAGARSKVVCSFCRKAKSAAREIVSAEAASVCGECLAVCRQILDDRA